jgi:hypothetical protein
VKILLQKWWTVSPATKMRCSRFRKGTKMPTPRPSIYPRIPPGATPGVCVRSSHLSVRFLSALPFYPFLLAQVPQPVATRPTDEQFWVSDHHGRRKPNPDFLRDHFLHEGRLTEDQALVILRLCGELMSSEPNVLRVKSPVTGMSSSHPHLRPLGVECDFV